MADTILRLFYLTSTNLTVNNSRYYPLYHLAPHFGWMSEPTGFCMFQNIYHIFYQHNPNSSMELGISRWGHALSHDLFHWDHFPIALHPESTYDSGGIGSGSAMIENSVMYLFYTGSAKKNANETQLQQSLAISIDGVKLNKYDMNPIIRNDEKNPNMKDPKVWQNDDSYYMVLGNSGQNGTRGSALLYVSKNLISWEYLSVLDESDGSLGFRWDHPDFFELKSRFIFIFSPKGIPPQGDKYKNIYLTGYMVGDFEYKSGQFTPTSEFRELDHGHDFYGAKTLIDELGRRILIAWLNMWERNYPEKLDGFSGYMTIPRVLKLSKDGRLLQKPVKEIVKIRETSLRSGAATAGTNIILSVNSVEIKIKGQKNQNVSVSLEFFDGYLSIRYDYRKGTVTLDRGGPDGVRRTKWRPRKVLRWLIYVDTSSVELFCGKGEVTFSSRFFPNGPIKVVLGESDVQDFSVNTMQRTIVYPIHPTTLKYEPY